MKFDEFLFSHLGEMGKYQRIQFALVCLPTIFTAMHALSWTFAGVQVPHRCQLEGESKDSPYWIETNSISRTDECVDSEYKAVKREDEGARCYFDKCTVNGTECDAWVMDGTRHKSTALSRWDMVCSRALLKAFIQSAYYIGQMAGSMIFGVLGDKIGRKKVFVAAILIQIVCGFLQSIAPTWYLYALFRMGTGFSHPGIFVIAVVIGMELVGPKYRKLASVVTGLFFALGQVILGLVAMHVTHYQILHVILSLPAIFFLSYWWLVPESARWLVSMRKYKEADQVLQRAAKVNGVTLPSKWWLQLDGVKEEMEKNEEGGEVKGEEDALNGESKGEESSAQRSYGFGDLLKTREMRKRSLIVFFLWPVVSMVYYGLSMKSDVLGGDLYVNFVVGGFIEIPALLIVYLLIDRIGRRIVLSSGYGIAGFCLLSNLIVPEPAPFWLALIQLLVSKGAITATYASIYTFSPELFPTVVRNSAMGVCSTIARVGAITASYVSMWIVDRFGRVFMIIPFGSLCVISSILILLFLPETMGKPLPTSIEEVEEGSTTEREDVELELKKEEE